MASSFKDRLTLDEAQGQWMDQTRRYLLIRPDALMGVFRRLPQTERQMAFEALADSIFEQGSDSARAYQAMGGTGESLMQVIAESAPQLGWGQWQFEKTESGLRLTVHNSPFADGYGPSDGPVCWSITGMMRAVSTLVLGRATQAREIACKATGADACCFLAEPAGGVP